MSTTSNSSLPTPFSFAPSQYWNGNDGSWSSFIIRIGSPTPQDFKVFPSTSGQETLIPLPEGCTSDDPSDCGSTRGVMPAFGAQGTGFLTNDSDTWDLIGLYSTNLEDTLGYSVNAQYGRDTVGLQIENSGGLNVTDVVVGGIAAKDFYLGYLGIGPKPSNFTTFTDPLPSLMHILNSTQQIPSLAYGYTAGASYRFSKVLGSLTLGGYDSSRFEPTDLIIPFASDDSRPLQVAIQSITGTSSDNVLNLLPTPIFAAIDSTLPYLWLPQAACDMFESSFSLTYDNTTDLYTVNDTAHSQLLSSNPTITFKFGSTLYDGTYQNIALPYAAFDLTATYPIYANSTRYFPIRRAANDTQYTLGRALLQEAYITVDHERKNFSIAQANFSADMPGSNIVPIYSPVYNLTAATTNTTSTAAASTQDNKSSTLSTGAIAGIAIGSLVLLSLVLTSFFFYCFLRPKRRRQRNAAKSISASSPPSSFPPSSFPNSSFVQNTSTLLYGSSDSNDVPPKLELSAAPDTSRTELPAPLAARDIELEGETMKWGRRGVQELAGGGCGGGGVVVTELDGSEGITPELEGGGRMYELGDEGRGRRYELDGGIGRVAELEGEGVEKGGGRGGRFSWEGSVR